MKREWQRALALCALTSLLACGSDRPSNAQFVSPTFGDPCANDKCSGQGVCNSTPDASSGPICNCNPGYAGDSCERCDMAFHRDANQRCVSDRLCVDQVPNPCGVHGTCSDGDGVIFCACDTGYEGPRCTLCSSGYDHDSADECLQKVLANGRTMTLPAACDAGTCSNHGQCSELDTTITCDCYAGYVGGHCENCDTGYQRPAGIGRCEPNSGCQAPDCGGCVVFDGGRSFPDHPDTCNASQQLMLEDITLTSTGGEGSLWLCAQSSRYMLTSEHVGLEAGSSQPARITFSKPIRHLSLDYVPWESFALEVLGDDHSVFDMSVQRYMKGSLDLQFDQPITVLALRSNDQFAHSVAIDNIVYQFAAGQCP